MLIDSKDFIDDSSENLSDTVIPTDTAEEIDEILDAMSLDELLDLRDKLTDDSSSDFSKSIPDISDLTPIDDPEPSDFSFHWDGGPTHDTDLDEYTEPSPTIKKLTR